MAEHRRLFFALWPDEALRQQIAAISSTADWPPAARRVPAAHLHLTLVFLGDVPAERVDAVRSVAASLRVAPFKLSLAGCGHFPRAEVGWLGCVDAPPALFALNAGLHQGLRTQGFALRGESFRPHVTLARGLREPPVLPDYPPLRWPVSEFVLVESRRGRAPAFTVIGAWPLAPLSD